MATIRTLRCVLLERRRIYQDISLKYIILTASLMTSDRDRALQCLTEAVTVGNVTL